MPFSIVRNSSGEIQKHRVNRFDAAWFIVSICVFSLVAFLTYEHLIYVHNAAFILNSIVFFDNIHITMELVFAVLFIGMDMYNRSYIVDMMKLLATFDKEVNWTVFYMFRILKIILIFFLLKFKVAVWLRVNINFKQEYRSVWLSCLTATIMIVILIASTFYYLSFMLFYKSSIYFPCDIFACLIVTFITTANLLTFFTILNCLRTRYANLNAYLR